jgi:hypothetical protein
LSWLVDARVVRRLCEPGSEASRLKRSVGGCQWRPRRSHQSTNQSTKASTSGWKAPPGATRSGQAIVAFLAVQRRRPYDQTAIACLLHPRCHPHTSNPLTPVSAGPRARPEFSCPGDALVQSLPRPASRVLWSLVAGWTPSGGSPPRHSNHGASSRFMPDHHHDKETY